MDLREKPSKIQKILEFFMRIRLLSVLGLIIATVALLVSNWGAVALLPTSAHEPLASWISEFSMDSVTGSSKFILVAALATVVMFLVFGKLRGLLSSIAAIVLAIGGVMLLGDASESMGRPVVFFSIVAGISLIAVLFVKFSVACGLFPFMLSWLFFSTLVAVLQPSLEPAYLVWAALSVIGFAGAMSVSSIAGKYLSEGMPQGGALTKAVKQVMLPVVASSLLVLAAIIFDVPAAGAGSAADVSTDTILYGVLFFFVFNLWFFAILFPLMTFAPWERLRSGSRRVELKEKKSTTKGKKK